MSSRKGFEPIEDGGELDEREKVEGKLLVAGADASLAFDALEEVLHAMAEPVIAAMPAGRVLAVFQVGDARIFSGVPDPVPERRRVIALVGHQPVSRWDLDSVRAPDVALFAGVQKELERAALGVHQCGHLGVESPSGWPNGLPGLATVRLGGVQMGLQAGGVEMHQSPLGDLRDQLSRPEPSVAPPVLKQNGGMEVYHWVNSNGFNQLEAVGIIASLTYTGVGFHQDDRSRRIENLLTLTESHRGGLEVDAADAAGPEAPPHPGHQRQTGAGTGPPREEIFATLVDQHLGITFQALRSGTLVNLEGGTAMSRNSSRCRYRGWSRTS